MKLTASPTATRSTVDSVARANTGSTSPTLVAHGAVHAAPGASVPDAPLLRVLTGACERVHARSIAAAQTRAREARQASEALRARAQFD